MTAAALAPEAILANALIRLRMRSPFFATLALFAQLCVDDSRKEAATDGRRIFVPREHVQTATAAALEYTILHEVLHAALLHPSRRKARDVAVWNAAADIVVNGILAAQGLPLPANAVRDAGIEDWRVEDIYELLLRERAVRPPITAPPDLLEPADLALSGGTARAKELETHWQTAVREADAARARKPGEQTAGINRFVRAVGQPSLDWRAHLWRFLARTPTDFAGFDRRFVWQGVYLDALAGESLSAIVCVDTSGSIKPDELAAFAGEIEEIARTYPHIELTLYCADRTLRGPLPFRRDAAASALAGGGGTSFVPFFEKVERDHAHDLARSVVCIYLTDGHGEFPKRRSPLPTLWVVTDKGAPDAAFPFGDVVRLGPTSTLKKI